MSDLASTSEEPNEAADVAEDSPDDETPDFFGSVKVSGHPATPPTRVISKL